MFLPNAQLPKLVAAPLVDLTFKRSLGGPPSPVQTHTGPFSPAKLGRTFGELCSRRIQRRKYPGFTERYMKRQTGSPRLYLASAVTEKMLEANSEQRLHSIVTTLEECRADLIASGNREAAQLVSVAILQLRMKLNRIADAELKALCDAIMPADAPVKESQRSKSQGQRRRAAAFLKLVD
jgi:hypothetical protein